MGGRQKLVRMSVSIQLQIVHKLRKGTVDNALESYLNTLLVFYLLEECILQQPCLRHGVWRSGAYGATTEL